MPRDAPTPTRTRCARSASRSDRPRVAQRAFDAAQWVARRPGDTPNAKLQAAQALLLPLAPRDRRRSRRRRRRAGVRARHAARSRVPAQMTLEADHGSPHLPASRRCSAAAARVRSASAQRRGIRRRAAPARPTASCSCWSSSRAATTASTRSCPTPTRRTTRCARRSRSRATRSCSSPIARDCIRRSRRSLPLWKDRQLAVLQGVGYPEPNLSHFRSIEIWDTASKSEDVPAGRLAHARVRRAARAALVRRRRRRSSARNDLGPLAGGGTRADRARRTPSSSCAGRGSRNRRGEARNKALAHILQGRGRHRAGGVAPRRATRVRDRVSRRAHSATRSGPRARSSPILPAWPSCASRCRASTRTANQPATQARLLAELAQRPRRAEGGAGRARKLERHAGADLRGVRTAAARRTRTTAPTTARRTSHFALGGRVAGGLYGAAPDARSPVRRRQPRSRARLSRGLRDRARALVGHAVARRSARCAGAVRRA